MAWAARRAVPHRAEKLRKNHGTQVTALKHVTGTSDVRRATPAAALSTRTVRPTGSDTTDARRATRHGSPHRRVAGPSLGSRVTSRCRVSASTVVAFSYWSSAFRLSARGNHRHRRVRVLHLPVAQRRFTPIIRDEADRRLQRSLDKGQRQALVCKTRAHTWLPSAAASGGQGRSW